jgi:hypothetical protein
LFLHAFRGGKFAMALALLALGSCRAPDSAHSPEPESTALASPQPQRRANHEDFSRSGGIAFTRVTDGFRPDGGMKLSYSLSTPDAPVTDALVVLGHGFLRGKERMMGLADHLASHGLRVAVPDFRHSRPWAGRHRENAADLIALARHLGAERVIYGGFSAGGLSALIAAAEDPRAIGFLGLDLVDNGEGESVAKAVGFPLHALFAAPSKCNANGNGRAVCASARRPVIIEVNDASHCDFEFPSDWKCRLFCRGGRSSRSRENIRGEILGMATAILLDLARTSGKITAAVPSGH